MIKNLVFKGGGVLGIAYAGALKVLEDNGILQGIEKVAGTSAGSIVAMLVALKYSATEIYSIVNTLDFGKFEDEWNPFRELTEDSLYKGGFALQWLQDVVKKKVGYDIPFADMNQKGYLDLHIIATDLRTRGPHEFSISNDPSMPISLASRASMAIPGFFEPIQGEETLYVDGGVMWNYPLTIFDKYGDKDCTLGLYLHDTNCKSNFPIQKGNFSKFAGAVIDCLLSAQDVSVLNDPDLMSRTVLIDDLGISATDFTLIDQQKKDLYNSGIKYMTEYLTKNKII